MSSRAEDWLKTKVSPRNKVSNGNLRESIFTNDVVEYLDAYAQELLKEQQEKIGQLQKDLELSDFMCQQAGDKGIELMRKIELLEKEISEWIISNYELTKELLEYRATSGVSTCNHEWVQADYQWVKCHICGCTEPLMGSKT